MGIVHVGLISRLGWKRAGARYKTRGIDDNGDVANFVEVSEIGVESREDPCCRKNAGAQWFGSGGISAD